MNRARPEWCWIALTATLATQLAAACDLCTVYSAIEAKQSKPGFNVGAFEQFTRFGTLEDRGYKEDNPTGQSLDSSITQLILGYQFNERFDVQANLPYIYRCSKARIKYRKHL